MPTHIVTALHLNLRSEPDPTRRNVIAVLPQGTAVDKIANSGVAGWFEVDAVVAGTTLRGHVNKSLWERWEPLFLPVARPPERCRRQILVPSHRKNVR